MKPSVLTDLDSIDELYRKLDSRAEKLYDFVYYYNKYMKETKDYGTGNLLSAPMAHILTNIEEEPGLTITQLAKDRNRTTSAISQTVTALQKDGYIYKEKRDGNDKELLLYPTEKGKAIARAHKIYDIHDITSTTNALLKNCSVAELDTFYKVLDEYLKILLEE